MISSLIVAAAMAGHPHPKVVTKEARCVYSSHCNVIYTVGNKSMTLYKTSPLKPLMKLEESDLRKACGPKSAFKFVAAPGKVWFGRLKFTNGKWVDTHFRVYERLCSIVWQVL